MFLCVGFLTVLFGGYEIAERAWLARAWPDRLPLFHIMRGVGSSVFLAGIVTVFLCRRRVVDIRLPQIRFSSREGRPGALEGERLAAAAEWLVGLRWLALVAVLATIGVSRFLLPASSQVDYPALCVAVAAFAGLNAMFLRAVRAARSPSLQVGVQIVSDLVFLTLLLHWSGGVSNPFFIFYSFLVVLAAMLLPLRVVHGIGAGAVGLFAAMAIGEATGVLPSHPWVGDAARGGIPGAWLHLAGVLTAFAITVFCLIHFAGAIVRQLRQSEADRIRLQESHQHQQRLALLGEITAGVAHEIRNPLSGAINFLSLLKRNVAPPMHQREREQMDLLGEALHRIQGITDRLLVFSRQRRGSPVPTDLPEVVRRSLDLIRHRWDRSRVILDVHAEEGVPHVLGDSGSISDVVTNLVSNALDAVGERGRIRVEVKRCRCGTGGAELVVEDDGCGIPQEHRDRVSAPFFTTKPIGKGCGLGLATCRRVVEEECGGTLTFTSEVGAGTRFVACFPASSVPAGARAGGDGR
ncbi:MAG: hypothetical protein HY608_00750 [Planctomycetes bacterium]|nr:hypothetical protein [Planctomycetota bacterium]